MIAMKAARDRTRIEPAPIEPAHRIEATRYGGSQFGGDKTNHSVAVCLPWLALGDSTRELLSYFNHDDAN